MDDDREAYESSHALYLARQVDRKAAQMIVRDPADPRDLAATEITLEEPGLRHAEPT